MKHLRSLLITITSVLLLSLFSCGIKTSPKNTVTLSFSARELNKALAFREAEQNGLEKIFEVELYVNDELFENRTSVIESNEDNFSFTFNNIDFGSTVYVKARIDCVIKNGSQTSIFHQLYGQSDKFLVKSDSLDLSLTLKWMEGSQGEPLEKEISLSDLKNAIQNYTAGTYTIYKVKGQMTNDDYDEVMNLINEKWRNTGNWQNYIGLDLSEVTELTKVHSVANLLSLTIPNTVAGVSFERLFGLQVLPDNPYFTMEDGVLYSKDKTILYYYPMGKKAKSFEIPSGVKSIWNFAFEESGLEEVRIPESVIDIGMRAFYGQSLIFKDKENWISDITGKVLTTQELENPDNFTYFNMETYESGPCRNGIYKPVTKTVSVENIGEEISSFKSDIHTIFKVSGQATNEQYQQVCELIKRKGHNEGWTNDQKGYIGLDLTEVTGLTRLGNVGDFIFSLAIPDTVTEISYISSYSIERIKNISNHPNFEIVDQVLYSKDKSILYAYPRTKKDTSFTVPSTVTKINDGSFSGAGYIQNITIPESVVYIGYNAFTNSNIQTLAFENTEDWVTRYSNNPITETDLENPASYDYNGLCANGICKAGSEWVNGSGNGSSTETEPEIENIPIAASDLVEAINNYEPQENVYTIYKVTGQMTNEAFRQVFQAVWNKVNNCIWSEKYVGLDLSEVTGLTSIYGTWCFRSLVIPDTVTEIGDCTGGIILNLSSHPNFKYDENGILYTKDGATICYYPEDIRAERFTIPDGVKTINYLAFNANSYLKYLTIPASVTYIYTDAFNSALVELIFADSENWYQRSNNQPVSAVELKNPSNYGWNEETQTYGSLSSDVYKKIIENKTVTLSELKEELNSYEAGTYTIYKVTGEMSNSDFSDVQTILENNGWNYDYVGLDLSEVSGLNKIGRTFGISSLTIPSSVTEFGDYAQFNCVKILDGNTNFEYENGVLYSAGKTALYFYPADKTDTAFTIPSTVKRIQSAAFAWNNHIQTITVPASVEFIGMAALQTNSITTITFEDKNNWYNNSNQLISESDLTNPSSYNVDNGICRNGIHKTGN